MYAKLRLPPHIRSFSRCSFRQTATLAGPNDRIEPNYFLYRDVNFFGRKKVVFRGFRLRLPPHFRVFPSGWRGQTMGMRGSGDRIEQIYFQHQIFDFFFIFFGSYMYENFGNFLLIIFTISKIDFTIKKTDFRPETRESRVRRPGNLE